MTKAEIVIGEAHEIANRAMNELAKLESELHNDGYHHYSTVVSNFRNAISNRESDLIDSLMED